MVKIIDLIGILDSHMALYDEDKISLKELIELYNETKYKYRGENMEQSFIKCCECGEHMLVDDREIMFKGCENLWLLCPKCDVDAYAQIRFKQLYYIEFSRKGDTFYVEKFKIDRSK